MNYNLRNDLNILNIFLESLFIEISSKIFATPKDIVIGAVYRPPNKDIQVITSYIEEVLVKLKKENKMIYWGF